MRQVVVTGLGVISPVGSTLSSFFNTLKSGKSRMQKITELEGLPVSIGGVVTDIKTSDHFSKLDLAKLPRFAQLGIIAGRSAIEDAQLSGDLGETAGASIGTGIGGMQEIHQEYEKLIKRGHRKVSPFFAPNILCNSITSHLSLQFSLKVFRLAFI